MYEFYIGLNVNELITLSKTIQDTDDEEELFRVVDRLDQLIHSFYFDHLTSELQKYLIAVIYQTFDTLKEWNHHDEICYRFERFSRKVPMEILDMDRLGIIVCYVCALNYSGEFAMAYLWAKETLDRYFVFEPDPLNEVCFYNYMETIQKELNYCSEIR